jgi:hypothetical protein
MVYYCSVADVGSRLGLDSAQRSRASSRITRHIRHASIAIDQSFLEYGRDEPSRETGETTANGSVAANDTSIVLVSGTAFASAGKGNIDGDSFTWTGKTSNTLTGVTGISFDHATGVTVQQGEFAHVLREICADLAAGQYLEDEGTHQTGADGGLRGQAFRERGHHCLQRLAHLGKA